MKRKLLTALLAALALLFTLCSCSCSSFYNCTDVKCRDCGANILEDWGYCNDCADCATAMFVGEDCTDTCNVAPCYTCAGCLRTGGGCTSYATKLKDDLEKIDEWDCEAWATCTKSSINNLTSYYKINVQVSVQAAVPLEDVVVNFSVFDSYGNAMRNVDLYISDKIDTGMYAIESAEMVFTFSYGSGEPSDIVDTGEDGCFVEEVARDHAVEVVIHGVYGKY